MNISKLRLNKVFSDCNTSAFIRMDDFRKLLDEQEAQTVGMYQMREVE